MDCSEKNLVRKVFAFKKILFTLKAYTRRLLLYSMGACSGKAEKQPDDEDWM